MDRKEMLLVIAAEECNEVAQAISKTLRFGPDEVYPPIGRTNAQRICDEYNDLMAVIDMLVVEGVLDFTGIGVRQAMEKKAKVEKYLKYSQELGTLKIDPFKVAKNQSEVDA